MIYFKQYMSGKEFNADGYQHYEHGWFGRKNPMGKDDSKETSGIKPSRDAYTELSAVEKGQLIPEEAFGTDEPKGTSDNPSTRDPRNTFVPSAEIPDTGLNPEDAFLAREDEELDAEIDDPKPTQKMQPTPYKDEARVSAAWQARPVDTGKTVSSEQFGKVNESTVEKNADAAQNIPVKTQDSTTDHAREENAESHIDEDHIETKYNDMVSASENLPKRIGLRREIRHTRGYMRNEAEEGKRRGKREGLKKPKKVA